METSVCTQQTATGYSLIDAPVSLPLQYWVSLALLLIVCPCLALAQVSFKVSQENQVMAKFSSDALIKALERGDIHPEQILKVYVAVKQKEDVDKRPSVLGTYYTSAGQIIFEPLVPFSEGLPYLAVFGDSLEYQFQLAVPLDRPTTRLLNIYPTTDTLPANLLKIYLEFSAPMREGEVYRRVSLYNQEGDLVKNPFVPLQPELWDASGRIVTLWLDPGRVKRALLSREQHGPLLERGKSYRLEINPQWKDADGQALDNEYIKTIEVFSDDRKKPQIEDWAVTVPIAQTMEPLRITFGASMDFGTTRKAFSVYSVDGDPVAGSILVSAHEKAIEFFPKSTWFPGVYNVIVNSKIEDLAGNNLNRLFDRDLTIDDSPASDQESYLIEFVIPPANN